MLVVEIRAKNNSQQKGQSPETRPRLSNGESGQEPNFGLSDSFRGQGTFLMSRTRVGIKDCVREAKLILPLLKIVFSKLGTILSVKREMVRNKIKGYDIFPFPTS